MNKKVLAFCFGFVLASMMFSFILICIQGSKTTNATYSYAKIYVDGQLIDISKDNAAVIVRENVYLPTHLITKTFKKSIVWDKNKKAVFITD